MKIKHVLFTALVCSLFSCARNGAGISTTFEVDAATSSIEWKGSAPDHFHTGAFNVTGSLTANRHGQIKSGTFRIPIASIRNFDLEEPLKEQLLTHLKSADFFNLLVYSEARFRVTEVHPYTPADAGAISGANTLVTGDFTLIGQTHRLSFPAKVAITGDTVRTEATLDLNRLNWGMNSFSDPEQPLYILPEVTIHLDIRAIKANE
ncbi:YceI family protein [Niabella sp. CC-SYL272]|uniref:YceI family protein n=1 Tax=Niabella agricola TaxID=2891571 RepID=UPI001F4297A9|nr:YceI family protein [Niabella agricola]MCF3108226.1 YceI family protein [Niabella agricola]